MSVFFCERCGGVGFLRPGLIVEASVRVCASCIQDDIDDAVRNRPRARVFGQEVDMRRWTDDPVPPPPETLEVGSWEEPRW